MTVTRLLRIARQRLGVVIRPRAVEREIELELALHLDALTREKVAAGLTEADARREALREFGALDRIVEQSCDARGVSAVDGMVSDARYGWRLLRRTPGFTAVAGLALSIGIGATAAAAGAVAFVLARPLPFADGDRLITVRTAPTNAAVVARSLTLHPYHAGHSKARTIIAIGAARGSNHVLSEDGRESIRVQAQAYTPSLFALAGARPLAGRFFE